MEHLVMNLLHAAAWLFGLIFLFAAIGIYATVHFILNLARRTEAAVEAGVHNVEGRIHHQ